eukprot:4952514-Pyramimonas_sp.AAC.1
MELDTNEDIDQTVTGCLEDLYFQGRKYDSGEKIIAALEYRIPCIRSNRVLARSKLALKGFRRLAPGLSRVQLPWAALCAL